MLFGARDSVCLRDPTDGRNLIPRVSPLLPLPPQHVLYAASLLCSCALCVRGGSCTGCARQSSRREIESLRAMCGVHDCDVSVDLNETAWELRVYNRHACFDAKTRAGNMQSAHTQAAAAASGPLHDVTTTPSPIGPTTGAGAGACGPWSCGGGRGRAPPPPSQPPTPYIVHKGSVRRPWRLTLPARPDPVAWREVAASPSRATAPW